MTQSVQVNSKLPGMKLNFLFPFEFGLMLHIFQVMVVINPSFCSSLPEAASWNLLYRDGTCDHSAADQKKFYLK